MGLSKISGSGIDDNVIVPANLHSSFVLPISKLATDGGATFGNTITSGSSTVRGQFLGNCPSSITASSADAFIANYNGSTVARVRYDGSASFASGGFALNANGEISTNVKSAGHIELDSTGSFNSPKIKLFANSGNATFAGVGTFSGDLRVQDGGNFRVRNASNATQDAILLQNNGSITAAGGATFGGLVQSGGNPNDGTAVGAKMLQSGVIQAARASGSGSSAVYMGFLQGTSTATSRINANGGATFANGLITLAANGGVALGSTGTANGVNLSLIAGTSPAASAYTLLQGYQSDGSTAAFLLKASGSAMFSNDISLERPTAPSNVKISGSDTHAVWLSDGKFALKYDGSATFRGNLVNGSAIDYVGTYLGTSTGTDLYGVKSNAEKWRIKGDGSATFGRANQITGIAGNSSTSVFEQLSDSNYPLALHSAQTNKRGLGIFYAETGAGSSGDPYILCTNQTGTKFQVTSNGGGTFAGVLQGDQRVVVNGAGGKSGTSNTFLNYAGDGTTVTASIDANGLGVFDGGLRVTHTANTRHCRLLYDGVYSTGQDLYLWTGTTNSILFGNNSSSKMMLQCSTGALLLNRSSQNNVGKFCLDFYGHSENGIVIKNTFNGNSVAFAVFRSVNNDLAGTIEQTAYNAVNYGSGSDYRLKENIIDMSDPIVRIKRLKPKRFNFISDIDKNEVDGFLAHEAAEVVPEAVTGEKDGKEMQCIDHGKLVPLLTAALKEAISSIEALEARMAVLES
ncbi:MAG: hypothetical protein CML50_16620 [Rhodobacteraceae bacterium]|nr:hypothetical protein [Paracoccaceae bacterium]